MEIYNLTNPLYHGSRGGIVGDIQPVSRIRCDFGAGFYMGTNLNQAKSLISNDQSPVFYEIEFAIDKIPVDKILELKDMDWAYFVLFNRNRLDCIRESELYKQMQVIGKNKDVIVGPIADDSINESMNRFVNNQITDKAFLESIRALDYGIQFVAKTEAACRQIKILSEKELSGQDLDNAYEFSQERRKEGRAIADEMQKKYRREGKYFDEILAEEKIKTKQKFVCKGYER